MLAELFILTLYEAAARRDSLVWARRGLACSRMGWTISCQPKPPAPSGTVKLLVMVLWKLEEGDFQKDSKGKLEVLEEAVTNSFIAPALGTASFFQVGGLK